MADVDPRIRQFNEAARQALATIQRANVEAKTLQAQIARDAAVRRRLGGEAGAGRIGGSTLATESAGSRASQQVVTGSTQRTRAMEAEQAAQTRLNATRAQGVTALEAQAQAYRNAARYGVYAGGRRTFQESGYAGGAAGGPPIIPPGGRLPPPGGFPALPPPSAPKAPIGSSLDDQSRNYQLARAEANSYQQSVSRLAQQQNLASVAMHRHGALTTEFISAAQRGEVTIRELGYQTTSTIGKFGGWIVAGAAVYGVAAAMGQLGKGALDAFSGVNQVQRVVTKGLDATRLRQEFVGLAGEFNLPVETVSDAAYQMGKVFHDQNSALEASRAVLYSVKVGELDVATSTRYLTAIVNGFQLPATKMAEVFDQINAAQNRFGITIADVEAGLAKASGTFNAAGGDFSSLLAIITTAQKVTGNTGQVVGTALARAPNFLRQAANQDVLRQFGIEPGQAIDKIIEDAFRVSQKLSGEKLQQLAAAIFGPQYGARVGTPLLQQQELYEKVQRQTSPKAAKGSAAQELKIQLAAVDEQIKNIGTSLQQIGAELANNHAFDALGLLLNTLNLTLDAALTLSQTFGELPDGVQRTLSYALQLAVVMRLLRRFQLGEAIAGGPTGRPTGVRGALANAFDQGPIGEAKQFRAGLFGEQTQLAEQRAGVTTQINKAAGLSDAARVAYLSELDRNQVLQVQAKAGTDASLRSLEQSNGSLGNYKAEMVNQAATVDQLKVQAAYADQRLAQVNKSLDRTKRRGFFSVNQTLAERERTQGVQYYPRTFERPSGTAPATGAAGARAAAEAKGVAVAAGTLAPSDAEETMRRAERSVARDARRVGRVRGAMAGLGAATNSLINRVGTIFFALSIGLLIEDLISSVQEGVGDTLTDVENVGITNIRKLAQSKPKDNGGFKNALFDFVTGSGAFHGPIEDLLGIGSDEGIGETLSDIEEARITNARNILELQGKQRRRDLPISFQSVKTLQKRVKDIERSSLGREERLRALERVEEEADYSLENSGLTGGTTKQRKGSLHALQQNIDIAKSNINSVKSFADSLANLDPKTVSSWMDSYSSLISGITGGFNRGAFERSAAIYRHQLQTLGHSRSPDDLKSLRDSQEAFYEAISQAVEQEVTIGLELAETPRDRLRVAQQALGHLRQTLLREPREALANHRRELEEAQQRLEQAQTRVRELRETVVGPRIGPYLGNFKGGATPKELKGLELQYKSQRDNLKLLRKDVRERREYFEQIEKQIRQQVFEAVSAVRGARFDYRSSQTADPLRQAAIDLERINADLPGTIKAYGRRSEQVFALLAEREQVLAEQVQSTLNLIQARGDRAAAGIDPDDTLARDRAALANLQRQLEFARSHADRFDPSEIIGLETQVIEARVQLEEDVLQQAIDLRNARFEIQAARAEAQGKPIQSALVGIRQTRYQLRKADTPLEKLQLEAQLIQQLASKRDTVAQERLDTINFEAEIGKLTSEQEIAALERLLSDYKLSRDMRRQIRSQIYNLRKGEDADSFALDVGNITLPTIYDIRRAVGEGASSKPGYVDNSQNVVYANINGGNPEEVMQLMSDNFNRHNRNARRSAGRIP